MTKHSITNSLRTYATLNERLGKRSTLKVANNTRLNRRGHAIAVTLHSTDIATFQPDGSVTLTSGGWLTPTTKERLNWILSGLNIGVRIFAERSVWYVYDTTTREKIGTFADGMTLTPSGEWQGMGQLSDGDTARKLADRISRYARAYGAAFKAGEVEKPGPGDCFYCHLHEVATDKPLGEAMKDKSHFESHMSEGYFVPSLLLNAANANAIAPMFGSLLGEWLTGKMPDGWLLDYAAGEVTRILRRYLRQQLGLTQ